MHPQIKYFLLALGFFTRIPVPSFADFQESDLNHTAKYFPLIGIIVGLVAAGSFALSTHFLPHNIAVLISMAATIYLTGAFHEDGLADSADGIGGGWDREKILTIMQDSRLGTFGAVALFLVLFAKFQVLLSLNKALIPMVLIAAHAFSRLCAVYIMASLNYTKPAGKAKPLATQINRADLLIASLFGCLPLCGLAWFVSPQVAGLAWFKLGLGLLVPVAISWLWWRAKIQHWLGGYTGDTLGATQQITEIAFYLGFAIWSYNL